MAKEPLYVRDREAIQLLRDVLKLRVRAERLAANVDRPSHPLNEAVRLLLVVANNLAEVEVGV